LTACQNLLNYYLSRVTISAAQKFGKGFVMKNSILEKKFLKNSAFYKAANKKRAMHARKASLGERRYDNARWALHNFEKSCRTLTKEFDRWLFGRYNVHLAWQCAYNGTLSGTPLSVPLFGGKEWASYLRDRTIKKIIDEKKALIEKRKQEWVSCPF